MISAHWIVAYALIGQVGFLAPAAKGTGAPRAASPAAPVVPNRPAVEAVTTIHDERIEGPLDGFEEGRLTIATEPPQKVALDDVERMELVPRLKPGEAPPSVVTLVWLGQDNHDLAQASTLAGGNGIQDVHLQFCGLPLARRLAKVVVFASRAGGPTKVWATEPGTSNFWRAQFLQPNGSTTADLYLEPPETDSFDQDWEAWLTLDDNQTIKTRVRATTHTDNTLRVNTATAPVADAARGSAVVLLERDDTLRGEVVAIDEDSLSLKLTEAGEIKIPLLQVRACWLDGPRPDMIAAQLGKRGETDWVLFKTRDNTSATIDGTLKGLADGKLELTVAGESHKVAADRLLGFVLAARPPQPRPEVFYQVFELRDGQKLSGQLTALKSDTVELRTLWGADVRLPRPQVQAITCHNGKVTYLSDLEPAAVEEAPYFGRPRPYRRDRNLEGGPLSMKGVAYRKGLAVHSRSVLSYALDGRFQLFQATVGFDDGAPPGGSVACRVLADDRELYFNPKLRQSGAAVPLNFSVEGAKQLVLEIDFGEGEDIGDRVIWAGARLLREKPIEKPSQVKDAETDSNGTKG